MIVAGVIVAVGAGVGGWLGATGASRPPAVSALVPAGQLSGIGSKVLISPGAEIGVPAVVSATQEVAQKAPWYAPDEDVVPSQDYREAFLEWGEEGESQVALTLNPDGTQTVLENINSDAVNPVFSADGKWLAVTPDPTTGSTVIQVYHLVGAAAEPVTYRVPAAQITASGAQVDNPAIIGFTPADQILLSNSGDQLWVTNPDGSGATQFDAFTSPAGSLSAYQAVEDEATGTPQEGIVAVPASPLGGSQDVALLTASGTLIHTIPVDGIPLAFGPDGRYLLIQTQAIGGVGGGQGQGEVCSVVTYKCLRTPPGMLGQWLPNGDLVATIGSDRFAWWNEATGRQDTVPASFRKYQPGLDEFLPTALMDRVAAAVKPA